MSTATPFVILFPGRTGSSWLISSLQSHSMVQAEGEQLVTLRPRSHARWIRRLYHRGARAGLRAVGFKTKLKDVWDLDAFRSLLVDEGVRIIVMDRRNTVKLAVSTINARRLHETTGRWNRWAGDPVLPPFELAEADLRRVLAECQGRQRELHAFAGTLPLPRITVHYEDLLGEPERMMGEILAFLDVPPMPLASSVAKNTADDLSRVILNVAELRAAFAGEPFGEMF